MATKNIGISFNRVMLQGRVVGNPVVNGGWVTFQLLTLVPEQKADKSWGDTECMVPCLSNSEKIINTVQQYVADERQLYVEGYIKSWDGGCGLIVTLVKLGPKTIYNPENANNAAAADDKGQRFPS